MDQRWHGQGIRSDEFSLYDCADDVATLIDVLGLEDVILAGYSMGGVVAQRVWKQHGQKIQGLVLCSTSDKFRLSPPERLFFAGIGTAMLGTRGLSRSRTAVRAARAAAAAVDLEPTTIQEWALAEFRSTSPWAVGPTHDISAGHAACVLESERFVPALLEAAATVDARRRDFRSRTA